VKRSTLPCSTPRIARDMVALRFLVFEKRIELPAQGVEDMGDDDLRKLEEEAVAAFDKIRNQDNLDDDDVAEAERLSEIVTAVRTELGSRDEAITSRRNRVDALASDLDSGGPEDEEDGEQAGSDPEGGETGGEGGGDPAGGGEGAEEEDPALVASGRRGGAQTHPRELGGSRVRATDVAGRRPRPLPPVHRDVALTAAPDVLGPDVRSGEDFRDMVHVAEAVGRRASEYPRHEDGEPVTGLQRTTMKHGIAKIRKDVDPKLVAREITDSQVLDYAVDQHRLPGDSLVAAGGWCAPSETLYDLVELEAADALLDVPEIVARRGGIRFTPGPSFADIFAGTGFSQTEAQAIAGTTKPCYDVPCPPFTEVRAGAEGVCITSGILQDVAFPELTARVVRGALAAHAHKISAKTVGYIVAGSTVVPTLTAQGGAAAPVLNAIELGVEDTKYKYRMARPSVLESVFPAWSIPAMRADLAFRLGVEDFMSVTDAQIRAWFAARGIVPQFIYDWQDTAIGAATPATRWPVNLSFLLYPAGTWVRGMGDVISLDTVYDSAGLTNNQFTGLFSEESLLVAKLGLESRQYTVPICPDGTTAAGADIPCT
jgi:hypothetical protein